MWLLGSLGRWRARGKDELDQCHLASAVDGQLVAILRPSQSRERGDLMSAAFDMHCDADPRRSLALLRMSEFQLPSASLAMAIIGYETMMEWPSKKSLDQRL